MEKLLEIEDLRVQYVTNDAVYYALNGMSLDINEGEVLGLVGETGAGKTTAALSIMRLLPKDIGFITAGSIRFNDLDLIGMQDSGMRKIRGSQISMIFQDPMTSLNPVLTVGKQISEALEFHSRGSKSEIEAQVDEILQLVGIPASRKHEFPHQFSGGMKQRVVIAMALACKPKLLIADEPTTALDVTVQKQVLSLMLDLKTQLNTSMLLITHDLGIVAQTCDRVAIMYAGEIIEKGPVYDIFDKSGQIRHPYTDGLFGSLPSLQENSRRLKPIDGLMPDPTELPDGCKFHTRCPLRTDICMTEIPGDYELNDHTVKCHLKAV